MTTIDRTIPLYVIQPDLSRIRKRLGAYGAPRMMPEPVRAAARLNTPAVGVAHASDRHLIYFALSLAVRILDGYADAHAAHSKIVPLSEHGGTRRGANRYPQKSHGRGDFTLSPRRPTHTRTNATTGVTRAI